VDFATNISVPVHVRSSFSDAEGTWLINEEESMSDVLVSGVACDKNEAKITLVRVPDQPGLAAQIFGPIADAHISPNKSVLPQAAVPANFRPRHHVAVVPDSGALTDLRVGIHSGRRMGVVGLGRESLFTQLHRLATLFQ